MEIVKLRYYQADQKIVDKAYRIIRECGLVVSGTDTVYGLLTSPYSDECVLKLYKAKERPLDKPLPILASSVKAVLGIVEVDSKTKAFLKSIWPGPVTVILRVKENIFSKYVSRSEEYIGFRVPATPIVRLIAERNGGFVTGTSANISGKPAPTTVEEAVKQLGDRVDLYIDLGLAPLKNPSTVIRVTDNGIEVVREGVLSLETLTKLYPTS